MDDVWARGDFFWIFSRITVHHAENFEFFFRIYGHLKFTQVSKHAEKVIFLIYCSRGEKNLEHFWNFSKKIFMVFKILFLLFTQSKPVKLGQNRSTGRGGLNYGQF